MQGGMQGGGMRGGRIRTLECAPPGRRADAGNPARAFAGCSALRHPATRHCVSWEDAAVQTWMTQIRKGVIELWLMAGLSRGEMYGYEIFQQLSGRVGQGVSSRTVYPILTRLRREDLISGRMGSSPAGPKRRYFRLTARGEARLKKMKENWKEVARETDAVLSGKTGLLARKPRHAG
jgi:PadR family transcriptional regulator PadR